MQICILTSNISRSGGLEKMVSSLANSLADDYKVYIYNLSENQKPPFFTIREDVIVSYGTYHCVLPKMRILNQVYSIRRFIIKNRIDVLINSDIDIAVQGIPACIGLKTKVVTWEQSNYFNNWGNDKFYWRRQFAAKHSDALVVLTDLDKTNYQKNINRICPIYVIHNPMPIVNSDYDVKSTTIMSAGHLVKNKQVDLMIKAAAMVLPKHPEWKWIIFGDGIERDNLLSLIKYYGLEEQISLPGAIQDLVSQYRKAAMFVLASKYEGLPMVLLEAKAFNLPIVSFDTLTGPSEIVKNGVNGFLVEQDNVAELAAKIEELISNQELRKWFSKKSVMKADEFCCSKIMEQWDFLLNNL